MNHLLLSLALGVWSAPAVDSPLPFASFRAGVSAPVGPPAPPRRISMSSDQPTHRVRNALIGALIGGAAGIVTCTVISNIAKDPGTGFSTCTWKGYLLLGGSGAGLGGLIGVLVR
jgi:hypothetical protein